MKIAYPKYLFIIKYMYQITLTFVIKGFQNGFLRKIHLLSQLPVFLFWYKHHLLHNCFFAIFLYCICGASHNDENNNENNNKDICISSYIWAFRGA